DLSPTTTSSNSRMLIAFALIPTKSSWIAEHFQRSVLGQRSILKLTVDTYNITTISYDEMVELSWPPFWMESVTHSRLGKINRRWNNLEFALYRAFTMGKMNATWNGIFPTTSTLQSGVWFRFPPLNYSIGLTE